MFYAFLSPLTPSRTTSSQSSLLSQFCPRSVPARFFTRSQPGPNRINKPPTCVWVERSADVIVEMSPTECFDYYKDLEAMPKWYVEKHSQLSYLKVLWQRLAKSVNFFLHVLNCNEMSKHGKVTVVKKRWGWWRWPWRFTMDACSSWSAGVLESSYVFLVSLQLVSTSYIDWYDIERKRRRRS